MTLASTIKTVLSLSEEETGINRQDAIKNAIEYYKKDHPFLERVIKGETTFQEAYDPLIRTYTGFSGVTMPHKFSEEETSVAKENKRLVDEHSLTSRITHYSNSFIGLLATGITYGLVKAFGGDMDPASLVFLGLVFGAYGAVIPPIVRSKARNDLTKDLKVLDEQIETLYGNRYVKSGRK